MVSKVRGISVAVVEVDVRSRGGHGKREWGGKERITISQEKHDKQGIDWGSDERGSARSGIIWMEQDTIFD